MQWIKPIIDLIFYSNLWIACCALAMVLQTNILFTGVLQITPLAYLVFFSTLFIYALHRIVGISKVHEFIEDFERYQVITEFRNHIVVYAVLAAIGGAISFYFISLSAKVALVIPGIISLAYVLPFLKGKKRLRDFDHIKIYLIAVVWAFVSVLLPAIEMERLGSLNIWLVALEKGIFIFAITLPFDVRDLKVDAHANVRTIPAIIGKKKSKLLSLILLFFCFLLVIINYQLTFYESGILVALSLSYLLTGVLLWFSDRVQHDYFFTGLIDGTMLLQWGMVLVISNIG
jgi:4-hydroxybenzoate polyprenyltransferase